MNITLRLQNIYDYFENNPKVALLSRIVSRKNKSTL